MDNIVANVNEFNQKLPTSSTQCRIFFNDTWKLYQKILNYNYMKHQEFYNVLHDFLRSNWQQPFKLLDLGCGDGSFINQALQNTHISYYLGLDISEVAIAIARENLQLISSQQEFIQGDFFKVIPLLVKEEKKFDVILASFAFHHLQLAEKDYLLSQLEQLLLPGGKIILIDLVASEGENKEAYLQRYLENVQQKWLQLTSEEKDLVSQHMLESDYPETAKTIELLARNNRFKTVQSLYQDDNNSQLFCFHK